jgi:uncharacterized protein (TIGR03437 family)
LLRLACGILPAIGAWGQQYTISTIAGNQSLGAGFTGDQGPATSAQLSSPVAVTVDTKGNVYVADTVNHVIREITGGTISTIAGDNTAGYLGDVGTSSPEVPTSAELDFPSGVVVDSAGNVYIADTKNQVVREVSGSKISVYAGTAQATGYGCDNCPANTSFLNNPLGLALDSAGNLYIVDSGNNVVRVVNKSGYITTLNEQWVAAPPFDNPAGVAVDPTGQYVYITDVGDQVVWRFQLSNQTMTIFAGTLGENGFSGDSGPATSATLNDAAGVATDSAGNVYIADTANSVIRMVTPNGIINTIAGKIVSGLPDPGYAGDGGPATSARLFAPKGVYVDTSRNVYVADGENDVIRLLQPTSPPAISSGGVGNGFSYKPQISPGAAAVIYGTGFAAASVSASTPLATDLGGVTVTVNGETAPLYYVSPGQINFQVPWDAALGTGSIMVTVNAAASNTVSVPIVPAAPGLYPAVQNYGVPVYTTNRPTNPVAAGGIIIAYATGSGPVSSPQQDGAPAPSCQTCSLVTVTSTCTATLGTSNVTPSFCGLTPGAVGLVQVNITVPSGLASGTYPLTVSINGQASNSVNVSVK